MKTLCKIVPILLTVASIVLTMTMVSDYNCWQRWALCATGGLYVLDYIINQRWHSLRWKQKDWILISMIGFYLVVILRNALDGFPITQLFSRQAELMAPFFVLSLIGLLGIEHVITKRQIAYAMTLTCLSVICLTVVFCLTKAPLPDYIWCPNLLAYYHAQMHHHIGTHMSVDLYMNIALLFGLHVAMRTENKKEKIFFGIATTLIALNTCLSDGRSGILATLFVVGVFVVYIGWKWYGAKAWLGVVICIALAGSAMTINGRFYLPSQITNEQTSTPDPRMSLWSYTYSMIRQHPVLGHGYKTLEEDYVTGAFASPSVKKNYIDNMDYFGILAFDSMVEVHPHSTFLLLWLIAGILAPVAYMVIFVLACIFTKKEDRLFIFLFSFIILWQAIFDSFSAFYQPSVICWFILAWQSTNLDKNKQVLHTYLPNRTTINV